MNTKTERIGVGDQVRKITGYPWPGIVIMAGYTTQGEYRLVVECRARAVAGALHIYSQKQLEKIPNVSTAADTS